MHSTIKPTFWATKGTPTHNPAGIHTCFKGTPDFTVEKPDHQKDQVLCDHLDINDGVEELPIVTFEASSSRIYKFFLDQWGEDFGINHSGGF